MKQISAGLQHTCALLSDGMVRCWGRNYYGQLGNGTKFDSAKPALVVGLTDIISVAAGAFNTCAISSAGTISCWGVNTFGQLGSATVADSSRPIVIDSALPARQVAVGATHICSVTKTDGSVQCWGDAALGKLGNGSIIAGSVPVSTTVPGLSGVLAITAASAHSCAILENGRAVCWGHNAYSQLGGHLNEGISATGTPQMVKAVRDYDAGPFSHLSSSSMADHTCGVRTLDGEAQCWGLNDRGQTGTLLSEPGGQIGTSSSVCSVEATTSALTGVVQIAAGKNHSCALLANQTVVCWGNNSGGELGNGTTTDARCPVPVPLTEVTAVSAGSEYTCAITRNGSAWCWGYNGYGVLGDNTNVATRLTPVKVQNLLPGT